MSEVWLKKETNPNPPTTGYLSVFTNTAGVLSSIDEFGNVQGFGTTNFTGTSLGVNGVLTTGFSPSSIPTLVSNMGSTDTTINASSTSGYPTFGYLQIDSEIMTYTGINGNTFTGVSRGLYGFPASTHNVGATIFNYLFITNPSTLLNNPTLCARNDGVVGISIWPDNQYAQVIKPTSKLNIYAPPNSNYINLTSGPNQYIEIGYYNSSAYFSSNTNALFQSDGFVQLNGSAQLGTQPVIVTQISGGGAQLGVNTNFNGTNMGNASFSVLSNQGFASVAYLQNNTVSKDFIEFANNVGTIISKFDGYGKLGLLNNNPQAALHANTYNSSSIGAIIEGSSGQSSDLLQFQNNSAVVLAKVTASGNVEIPDGSASAPSMSFLSDPTTGIYKNGIGTIGITASGILVAQSTPNQFKELVGVVHNRTVASTNYTTLLSDYIVAVTAVPPSITISLIAAATSGNGAIQKIKDESGLATLSTPITINVAGGGTIDGASSKTITTAYGYLSFYSNGTNWFTI